MLDMIYIALYMIYIAPLLLHMIYIAPLLLHMIYIAPLLLHMIYISPISSCTSIFKIQVHSYAQVLMDMRHMMAMQDMMQCKTYDRWHYTYHACICCRTFNNNKCMRLETLCCPSGCPPSLWATNRLMDWVGLMGQDRWGNRLLLQGNEAHSPRRTPEAQGQPPRWRGEGGQSGMVCGESVMVCHVLWSLILIATGGWRWLVAAAWHVPVPCHLWYTRVTYNT